jgi:hypothetical protein
MFGIEGMMEERKKGRGGELIFKQNICFVSEENIFVSVLTEHGHIHSCQQRITATMLFGSINSQK